MQSVYTFDWIDNISFFGIRICFRKFDLLRLVNSRMKFYVMFQIEEANYIIKYITTIGILTRYIDGDC